MLGPLASVRGKLGLHPLTVTGSDGGERLNLSLLNRHCRLRNRQLVLKAGNLLPQSFVGVSGNPSKH